MRLVVSAGLGRPSIRVIMLLLSALAGAPAPASAQAAAPESTGLPPLALGDVPAAVRDSLERAHAAALGRPRDASAVGALAMILHAHEQLAAASASYRAARALDPALPSLAYLSAVVDSERGNHEAAVASLRAALALDPAYLPGRVRLAEALLRTGEVDASRAQYEALARDYPELAAAHYGLGHVASAHNDPRAASQHYRRAVELVPQFGAAHYALALAYRDLGDPGRAAPHLAAYKRHGNRRPALADPWLDRVRSMRGTARELIAQAARLGHEGQLDASIALHLRAIERDPSAAQAHVNLISLYGRTGRPTDAERHYRAAVALEANLAEAHYNYGVLLATTGREADALAAFGQAIEVNPFYAPAHNNLASLLARQGRLDEAAASYRQAIASDPRHRGARYNLGRLLIAKGRHRDAIEQLLQCLTPEDADTPRYRSALVSAYHRAGDLASAREQGERALREALDAGDAALATAIQRELERLPPVGR